MSDIWTRTNDLREFRSDLANPKNGRERKELFERLPDSEQDQYWANLRRQIDRKRAIRTRHTRRNRLPSDVGEQLKRIAPSVYVQQIASLEVEPGRRSHCPLPDHDDHSWDFRVSERGWYCHGCNRGGNIYHFASLMWSLTTRGRDFKELQERLYQILC